MTEQEQLKKIEPLPVVSEEEKAKRFDNLVEKIRRIVRAKDGLPDEEDPTYGFIKVDDIRQTTILPEEADVLLHTFMETMYKIGGDEWKIMDIMSESEKAHRKSEKGQNFGYFVLMRNADAAKRANELQITLPNTQPLEPVPMEGSQAPKKKGFFSKLNPLNRLR